MSTFFLSLSLTLINLVLLPKNNLLVIIALAIGLVLLISKQHRIFICALAGVVTGCWRYHVIPHYSFTPTKSEKTIVGEIITIPEKKYSASNFLFVLHSLNGKAKENNVYLHWYGERPYLQIKDQWRLNVRFNTHTMPPRFLHTDIVAEATVQKGKLLKRQTWPHSLQVLRQKLSQQITHHVEDRSLAAVLIALTIGSRHLMRREDWQVFQNTGTSHLIAISGLHVSLVAGLFYFIVGWLWRRSSRCLLWIPAQRVATAASLIAATLYALLAGFAVPCERALIMLSTILCGRLLNREIPLWYRLLFAFAVITLWQPFDLYSISFWLSFFAVGLLGYTADSARGLLAWLRLQAMMSIGLLPITLYFFQRVSLAMWLSNLVAIPYTSFILVPSCILSTAGFFTPQHFGSALWWLSAKLLQPLWWYLSWLAHLPHVMWQHSFNNQTSFLLSLLGVGLLLLPRGMTMRWLGLVFIAPLIFT